MLLLEVARPSTTTSTDDLVELANKYVDWGADALCVPIDSEATPSGLKDLFCVSRAVKVPVLAKDWFIHPLQVRNSFQHASGDLTAVRYGNAPMWSG